MRWRLRGWAGEGSGANPWHFHKKHLTTRQACLLDCSLTYVVRVSQGTAALRGQG